MSNDQIDPRALCGARNNADWYEAMFSAHGLAYQRKDHAFVAADCPPPYYSQLTVLAPDRAQDILSELRALAERFGGALGLKDSFCQLDLRPQGFETLFDASWVWRSGRAAQMPEQWDIVQTDSDLVLWEDSWARHGSPTQRRQFPASLLARDDVYFLGRKRDGRFDAGCIVNISADCVGLSNVFADEPPRTSFAQAAGAVSTIGGGRPIVGYASGEALDGATSAQFDLVGPLKIWVTQNARF